MIKIERLEAPALIGSPDFRAIRTDLSHFYLSGGTRELQERFPIWKLLDPFMPEVLSALERQFRGKCAYTEVSGTSGFSGAVSKQQILSPFESHGLLWHRPTSDAVAPGGDVSPLHYWWLALSWNNWYLASNHVESVKSYQFPVTSQRRSNLPKAPTGRPKLDQGLLLDPCEDYPAWWLKFDVEGNVESRSPSSENEDLRGDWTIRILDLNNQDLVGRRQAAVLDAGMSLATDPEVAVEASASFYDPSKPHIGAIAQYAARFNLRGKGISAERLRSHVAALMDLAPDAIAAELVDLLREDGDVERFDTPQQQALRPVVEFALSQFPQLERSIPGLAELAGRISLSGVGSQAVSGDARPRVAAQGTRTTTIESSDRIESVIITDFKAIRSVEITIESDLIPLPQRFNKNDPMGEKGTRWKVLLGENGSGKSSILQAITLALCGASIDSVLTKADLQWSDILRRRKDPTEHRAGRVFLRFTGGQEVDLRFDGENHWFEGFGAGDAPVMNLNVRAYGATRLLSKPHSGDSEQADRVAAGLGRTTIEVGNLFDPTVTVIDAKAWLLGLDDGAFNTAALTLGELLGDPSSVDRGFRPSGSPRIVRIKTSREILVDGDRLEDVSDGYRSVIAVMCDIMAGIGGLHLVDGGYSDLSHARGIVLIDEIGSHLHPRWRMEITDKLRRALPNVQFIATTHEPLCLRGLYEREVVRVAKYQEYGVATDEIDKAPARYRVDQLLTSEFFGLDSAIDPEVDAKFQRYYELRRATSRSAEHDEELRALDQELNQRLRPVLGYTRRDQLIYEAIDSFLEDRGMAATEDGEPAPWPTPEQRQQRRQDTVDAVKALWKEASAMLPGPPR